MMNKIIKVKDNYKNYGVDSPRFGKFLLAELNIDQMWFYYGNGLADFFEVTEEVKVFQKENDLIADGKIGNKTKNKKEDIDLTFEIKEDINLEEDGK